MIYLPSVVQSWDALDGGDITLLEIASPAITVSPEIPISDLIDEFQDAGQEVALVVEDDRPVGLLTATDAFETIAGELEDPLDTAE